MKVNGQVKTLYLIQLWYNIFKISNVYNSFIINVDCFVAYWLLVAFINIFQCNEHVVKQELD